MRPSLDDISSMLPGVPLFVKLWGSHSHNTNVEGSDYDYLAVYQAGLKDVLSIGGTVDTFEHKKPDLEAHEVGKFCVLLLKGNPAMIEMLYTDRECNVLSEAWADLREQRQRFLSKQVVLQYLGYAKGQLQRLRNGQALHTKGGSYNTKWAYHALRVAGDAYLIASGKPPTVWKEGRERQFLLDVRYGKLSQLKVEQELAVRLQAVEHIAPWPLPDRGDEAWLNHWLYQLRIAGIESEGPRG